ncbi:hypothetical protein [Aurantiacibacter flavus]|uniref:Uncharacterized protein n=1 Tax=Aurantiacibacter flavus TaxID=3145232 RepID=A0ABV0CVI6_9SPHN
MVVLARVQHAGAADLAEHASVANSASLAAIAAAGVVFLWRGPYQNFADCLTCSFWIARRKGGLTVGSSGSGNRMQKVDLRSDRAKRVSLLTYFHRDKRPFENGLMRRLWRDGKGENSGCIDISVDAPDEKGGKLLLNKSVMLWV